MSQMRHEPVEDVVTATLDDETVLLNVVSGVYFGLDEVGTRIWQLMVDGGDHDAIVSRLADEYDVGVPQLSSDVSAFLAELQAQGLVRGVVS
ncbi:MAG: PqqD family protein [Chloroflexota bacterium]